MTRIVLPLIFAAWGCTVSAAPIVQKPTALPAPGAGAVVPVNENNIGFKDFRRKQILLVSSTPPVTPTPVITPTPTPFPPTPTPNAAVPLIVYTPLE